MLKDWHQSNLMVVSLLRVGAAKMSLGQKDDEAVNDSDDD